MFWDKKVAKILSKATSNSEGSGSGGGNSSSHNNMADYGFSTGGSSTASSGRQTSTGNYTGAATGYGKSGYGPVSAGKPGVFGGGVWGGRSATTAELAADRRESVAKQVADAKKTQGKVDSKRISSRSIEDRLTAKGILSGMMDTRTQPKSINSAYKDLTKDMDFAEKFGFTLDLYNTNTPTALKAGAAISQFPTTLTMIAASIGATLTDNLISTESNLKNFGEKNSGSMPNSSALSDNDLTEIAGGAKVEAQQSGGVPSKMLEQINYIREL